MKKLKKKRGHHIHTKVCVLFTRDSDRITAGNKSDSERGLPHPFKAIKSPQEIQP